jgi:endogenous inhibitor of DNA gyrase (YacG/DUF329 family)
MKVLAKAGGKIGMSLSFPVYAVCSESISLFEAMPQKPSLTKKQTRAKGVHCPTCRKLVSRQDSPYRPFCSRRCQVIDLADWASGKYKIPGGPSKERPEEE